MKRPRIEDDDGILWKRLTLNRGSFSEANLCSIKSSDSRRKLRTVLEVQVQDETGTGFHPMERAQSFRSLCGISQ